MNNVITLPPKLTLIKFIQILFILNFPLQSFASNHNVETKQLKSKNENLSNVELASCVNENDFAVNVHDLSFKLNEPTSKVKSNVLSKTGQEPSLSYIGQNDDGVTSFALDYKYNNQVFIYLSALNSDVYNIDEETITQMNFTTPNQFTSRGAGISSHFSDVLQKYGHCGVIEQNSGTTSITYSYFDRSLVFTVKENKVVDINYLTLPWSQVKL